MNSLKLKVAIVGARRHRQGLGPFFAKFFQESGADVRAILGRTPESVGDAADHLRKVYGIRCAAYTDFADMDKREEFDALVIASSTDSHHQFLELALAANKHVLCEKPLIWGIPNSAAKVEKLARSFHGKNLLLWENCQWPYTLPYFYQLHPGKKGEPLERLEMLMGPTLQGKAMLADTLPHALSLLFALEPEATFSVHSVKTSDPRAEDEEFTLEAELERNGKLLLFIMKTKRTQKPPRPGEYAINGAKVSRRIRMEDYSFVFESGDTSVEVPDPMRALIGDFIRACNHIRSGRSKAEFANLVVKRVKLLEGLIDSFKL